MADPKVSILYLGHYHLGDALFLQALSHAIARALRACIRPVLVHGPGEFVERRLQGEGIFLERENGMLKPTTPDEEEIIRNGLRELNRRLGRMLTDAVVPAVSVFGADRALFRMENGELRLGRTNWLETIVDQATVPVIAAAAARGPHEIEMAHPADLVGLLTGLFNNAEIAAFTTNNLAGILEGSEPVDQIAVGTAIEAGVIDDDSVIEALVLQGHRVLLTNAVRYPRRGSPRGSWLHP